MCRLKGLEHEKLDEQMSVDVGKGHRSQISQKTQKRKSLEEPVLLQLVFKISKYFVIP